ncbi:hypothetical protein KKF60_02845 [Patescibacteria group bacterium]|nr:hypothetical protein [Patescibacteria group bacterium]
MNKKLYIFIFGLLLIGLFMFAGSAAVATKDYNSSKSNTTAVELPDPGLTPDSSFYFLKTWKEKIQIFFTFGEENKAKQYLHLSEVRLAEYKKMIEKGKTEIAQKTLDKYEKQLGQALEKAEEAKEKGKDVEGLVTLVKEKTLKHQEMLAKVLEKAPEQAKKGIEKAIRVIKVVSECFKEGETYMPGEGQCCVGLKKMSLGVGDGRICSLTAGYVCTAFCGDGKCRGEYENACSCLEDCPKPEEISCTTNSDCGVDTCQQGRDKCVEIKYICEKGKCSSTSEEHANYSCAKDYYGSINFTGGTILEVEYKKVRPEIRDIAEKLADLSSSISIQLNGEKGIILKMKHIDEITHQQILQRLGEVEEKYFESVRGTIDYSKCMDTCGDDICRLPETKDWCSEDCPKSEEKICEDLCGDGVCQQGVCLATGCPCAETSKTCSQDCLEE